VINRGPQEVAAQPTAVRCDAILFEELLARGELAAAVKLWRGDLLDGITIATASSDFQNWLDAERRRFRYTAARAAAGLAERAARSGDASSADRWGRRAMELVPLEEAVLHRVLAVYLQLGHRSAAERLYREFAKRMRVELELEPSVETRSLVAEVRGMPLP
jgi:DNA-binding SARP family transcriptional activator